MWNHYSQRLIILINCSHSSEKLIQVTWLDTQNKHLLAEVAIHGNKVFMWTNQLQQEGEVDQYHVSQKHLEPIERKLSAT